jgi:hypothetical protein
VEISEEHRTVHCVDAIAWLEAQPVLEGCSLIASLPDVSEFPQLSLEEWKRWFMRAARLVIERTPPEGVAIFYQSDVKKEGAWVDKGYLVSRAAEEASARTLWHKIVCRRPAGTVTFGRPAYSHLIAFSRGLSLDLARSSPDVLPEAGESLWTRGMGRLACELACRFVADQTSTRTVVNPFCGRGTVLATANDLGLRAIGIELSPKRARQSRTLSFATR